MGSILITLFSFTLSLITPMFVGHLGELEPAGTSISNIDIQGLPYGVMLIGQEVDVAVVGQLYARGLLPQLLAFALFFLMQSINYWNWDFQIMLGLSYAASICVGNELGAGHQKVARFSVIVVVMASITFSIFVTLLVITLSTLYTSSTTVIEAVNSLMPLLAFSIFLNGIQPILSGAAIGSGWQTIVAYVNVGAYYLIGLPIGCILGYKTSLGAARKMLISSSPSLCSGNVVAFNHKGHCANNSPDHSYSQD
ncbi:protein DETOXIFICATION 41-like [Panicum virgatum]|uniref:protein DETOXIFICATION 41-like n=1 Tax=Panicum virgatum TaxID=38727 RepID=UPI0019D65F75|nr:protein DETOXIFICATION 41-like [Panicum virgatum]